MSQDLLEDFQKRLGRETIAIPWSRDGEDEIKHFVWVVDVPREDLARVHNEAIDLSLDLHGEAPMTFMIGVATAENTVQIRSDRARLDLERLNRFERSFQKTLEAEFFMQMGMLYALTPDIPRIIAFAKKYLEQQIKE